MTGIAPLSNIDYHTSEMILVMTVIGGTGNLFASVLGAAFYVLFADWLSTLWPRWLLLLGLLLIAVSLFMQRGLWGLGERIWQAVRRARQAADGRRGARMSEAILQASGIVKRYGKFTALGGRRSAHPAAHRAFGDRPERRRQDDAVPCADGHVADHGGQDRVRRPRRDARARSQARAPRHRAFVSGDEPVRQSERARKPAPRGARRRRKARV
jgi:hypothetical protein